MTASAWLGESSGARNAPARDEVSRDSEAIAGVSISVWARRLWDGHCTSSRLTWSTGVPCRSKLSAPELREMVSWRGGAERGYIITLGTCASRYQVTTRVHSPASVGAISSPTSALSRVDLPALTLPAIATRSGSANP